MKKMKNDNKGFTLVELIVVLVILAILAAILVPALLGYIDEAKQKQLVLHGKSVYTAAQAAASQAYAKDKGDTVITSISGQIFKISDIDEFGAKYAYAKVYFQGTSGHAKWTVAGMDYCEGDDWVELVDGAWESGSGSNSSKYTQTVEVSYGSK